MRFCVTTKNRRCSVHRYLTYTVPAADAGLTVESILRGRLYLSVGLSRRLKRIDRAVLLNGEPCFSNNRVAEHDVVSADVLAGEAALTQITPIEGDLSVVYEDEDLLVINKPAGLLVHSAPGKREDTSLANLIAWHLGGDRPFHAVNRLDKSTSGLMVVAKSGYIHERLSEALHTNAFCRTYLAVCVGQVPDRGVIDAPIARCDDSVIKRCIAPDGAPSVTHYETILRTMRYSLVKLLPLTGRTHQLRLHMSHIGYPLVGDFLYGTECEEISRAALHSAEMTFVHPVTGITHTFSADLPEDMNNLIQKKDRIL